MTVTDDDTQPWIDAILSEGVTVERVGRDLFAKCVELAEVLWTFEWRESMWDIHLNDEGDVRLGFEVWVLNNDDPDDETVHPLNVDCNVDPYQDAHLQIREHIHRWLAHEADEQMFFDGERTFYPHDQHVTDG